MSARFASALSCVAAILAVALAVPAGAQGLRASDVVSAELRPGWRTEAGTHMAALHLRLAEGWKTYWRVPGDAGIPPRFDWAGSGNLAGVRVHWPRPEVFYLSGVRTLGFEHELVLPLEFVLDDPAAPAEVTAEVNLGVCEDVCIPVTLSVGGTLPVAGGSDARIDRALAARPRTARSAGLTAADCRIEPNGERMRLSVELELPVQGANEVTVFELSDETVWIAETRTTRQGGRLHAAADLFPMGGEGFALDRSGLRVTVIGDGRAVELNGCAAR